ncbi:hypothetical protein JCM1840_002135 [Sporobolomyces johnsonii]
MPRSPPSSSAAARLSAVSRSLTSSSSTSAPPPSALAYRQPGPLLGHLVLDDTRLPVHETHDPARLPREDLLLDCRDPEVAKEVAWLMRKWILRQDVFLLSSPGPYARRLAQTFLSLLHTPFEIVSLHRDVGESELKQGREIRTGGRLEYTDSPAVRAVKEGKVLILEGIERCERGVLPLLNNLLENREMNLEDGTHIVSAARYDLMVKNGEDTKNFIPAHPDFRIIALGCPVPPFPGMPIDPPFRSRFQARFLDSVEAAKVMARQELAKSLEGKDERIKDDVQRVVAKMSEVMASVQVQKEMRAKLASGISAGSSDLPLFHQTALLKLARFLAVFPPPNDPSSVTPVQFLTLLHSIHPALAYASPPARRALEDALKAAGFASWAEGIAECDVANAVASTGEGLFGWRLARVERVGDHQARLVFAREGCPDVSVVAAAGPLDFALFPPESTRGLHITPRFTHLLTALFQLHALSSFDISFVPSSPSLQSSSSSTSLVLSTFASILGYRLEVQHLYKELGGRELWMRRVVGGVGGVTSWEESSLVKGMKAGSLVWLEGVDTIGPTFASLARLVGDREGEMWEGRRLTLRSEEEDAQGKDDGDSILDYIHPAFRLVTTSSKSTAPGEWLTEELASNLVALPTVSMPIGEERALLLSTGCSPQIVDQLELFATRYRELTSTPGSKSRRLGTASLVRIAKRLARFPEEEVRGLVERTLLVEFLPNTEREQLADLLDETGLAVAPLLVHSPVEIGEESLVFRSQTLSGEAWKYEVPLFDVSSLDPPGASHVPYMQQYLDNSQQTQLMRDIATDLELLDENVLLLGNQGVGKNKIIDRLLQLMRRPREYVQLHRDSTTQSLMFQTTLEGGVIRYVESPLLRAIKLGRAIVVDEVDKAPPPVVASLASLAGRGEMTLSDGRKIRPSASQPGASPDDIIVHPRFRLVLLANRPGHPFLGNPFLRVLGDNFSCYAVRNPDVDSELMVLRQLAPELDEKLIRSLVQAFQDLRKEFEKGTLTYPMSLRELLALVRHLQRFPSDSLDQALRNIFDFDVHSPDTLDALYTVLQKYRLGVDKVGIDAVRGVVGLEATKKEQAKIIEFEPKGDTSLSEPKYGKEDDKPHSGGNTWAGGTGGRDTAGLGGRGGYMRLFKGHDVKQIPDSLKADVPDEIKDRARDMARKELADKLKEIDLSSAQSQIYSRFHDAVSAHVQSLVSFLENLEAKEEERVWLKRQSDGELDESRLSEGLTGEATVYKRRGMEKPELGRPQLKPKRIRFVFDLSASMYRNQMDGRLARSLEAAVMILEAFDRLSASGKQKYRLDLVGHSGEEAVIPLVEDGTLPAHAGDRFRIIQKMSLIPQYCWPGDHTVEAMEKAVDAVAEADADDYFVITITDANFDRYGITAEDLRRALNRHAKVKSNLVAIGEGGECEWLPKALPGQAFRVKETSDIARTLRSILSQMLGGGL